MAGAGYAGKLIPAIALKVLEEMEESKTTIDFQGIFVKNGLVDLVLQTQQVGDSTKAAGILTWDLVDQYEALERRCVGSIYKAPYKAVKNCKDVYRFLDVVEGGASTHHSKRMVDDIDDHDRNLDEYMRLDVVKSAFRIPDTL